MILRRITEHVKAQNWTAVALDFFIVVVGVFMGIQLGNWNDARGEGRRAELLKVRLIDDFSRIEDYTADNIRRMESWQAAAERASHEILAGDLIATRTDLHERLEGVDGWLQPPGTSPTYNEIISQGDMDLLKSSGLRAALLEFNIAAERHIDANLVLIQSVGDESDVILRIKTLAALPESDRPEEFSNALKRDLASPELYLSLSNFMRARDIDLGWLRLSLARACAVLQALEQPCAHAAEAENKDTE